MKIGDEILYIRPIFAKSQYDDSQYHDGFDTGLGWIVSLDAETVVVLPDDRKRLALVARDRVFPNDSDGQQAASAMEERLDREEFGDLNKWKYQR